MKKWPNKSERELQEIQSFIAAYKILGHGREFEIFQGGIERPDFKVRDVKTREIFGIELTSVYLDERSVPDRHKKESDKSCKIPFESNVIEQLNQRIISAIKGKVSKARSGYDTTNPLILSVYMNEYESIFLERDLLTKFAEVNSALFDSISPFQEIVFCNLGNGGVFSIRPD